MKLANPKLLEKYSNLSPSRRTIVRTYFDLRAEGRLGSNPSRIVAETLGYVLATQNHDNSTVATVLRDFFRE